MGFFHSQSFLQQQDRIMEGFGLGWTVKLISFHPLDTSRDPGAATTSLNNTRSEGRLCLSPCLSPGMFLQLKLIAHLCPRWFSKFRELDFARAGNKAPYGVSLDTGPLEQFPHSMEPQLRQLGLPTALKKGTAGREGQLQGLSVHVGSLTDNVKHRAGFRSGENLRDNFSLVGLGLEILLSLCCCSQTPVKG